MNRYPIDLFTREGRNKFYQSKEWRALRLIKLTEDVYCEECLKVDLYEIATEVDHIIDIKLAPDRFMDITNLQSMCQKCHSKKTFKENKEAIIKQSYEVVNLRWKIKKGVVN